ncbi:MAG: DUF2917 domain-containing protein [Burkholderiaceae bacterium]
MNTNDLNTAAISLRKGGIHRLRHHRGHRIETLSGSLWVTIDNDLRDIVLEFGEGFDIDGSGDALISALTDARFVLLEPAGQPSH